MTIRMVVIVDIHHLHTHKMSSVYLSSYHYIHKVVADHDHVYVEVILSLYNPNSMEYTETDERHYSGQYSDERHKRGHGQLQPYG
jgi:hypothetical protein